MIDENGLIKRKGDIGLANCSRSTTTVTNNISNGGNVNSPNNEAVNVKVEIVKKFPKRIFLKSFGDNGDILRIYVTIGKKGKIPPQLTMVFKTKEELVEQRKRRMLRKKESDIPI